MVPVERLDDFGCEDRFELLEVCVLVPQIAEHISASPHHFQLFAFRFHCHRNISLNLFKRSLIRSISRFGVLMPCVDFFWKAWTTQISSASCTAYTTRNASPRSGSAISNTPDPKPCIGFAISDVPPSAAIVKAVRQIDLAPSGNFSNSLSAALIQEMGRVFLVVGFDCLRLSTTAFSDPEMLSYMTTNVKGRGRSPSTSHHSPGFITNAV